MGGFGMLDLEQYVPEEYMSLYQVCKEVGKIQKQDSAKCDRVGLAIKKGTSWYYFKLFVRCTGLSESEVRSRLGRIMLMSSWSDECEVLTKEEEGVLRNNFLLAVQEGDLLYEVCRNCV